MSINSEMYFIDSNQRPWHRDFVGTLKSLNKVEMEELMTELARQVTERNA